MRANCCKAELWGAVETLTLWVSDSRAAVAVQNSLQCYLEKGQKGWVLSESGTWCGGF